jgi:hypothetical protein
MSEAASRQAFDPYAILHALEGARVDYILIGALARVLQGSDEVTRGVDFVPSPRLDNLDRLREALERMGAEEVVAEQSGEAKVRSFESPAGKIAWVKEPAGTRGFTDLRRRARRLHLGEGLRPQVAAPGDLVRMLEAFGRPEHGRSLQAMRRIVELERGMSLER